MSYHGQKNVEQSSQFEGQAQLHKAAYGTSSEASINEVMKELSGGQSKFFKQGVAGSSVEEGIALESQGGGFKKGGRGYSHAQVGEAELVGQGLQKLQNGFPNDAEFGKLGGKGIACEVIDKKNAEMNHIAQGEAFAHKAQAKENSSTWDRITNGVMFGLGAALGPAGFPLMLNAGERMIRDNNLKSMSESGSSGYHGEMIQRGKMLKSWKVDDE